MGSAEDRVAEIVAERGKPNAKRSQVSPNKAKVGRPLKDSRVDESVINDLARIGCTWDELEALTGLSRPTLESRFFHVIEKGRAEMRMSLRRQQIRTALSPVDPAHGTMLVWLGKTLLGQSETSKVELTGANGGPVAHADATADILQAYALEALALVSEAERIASAGSDALCEAAADGVGEPVLPAQAAEESQDGA